MKILGMSEVVLNVESIAKTKPFYRDVLGFPLHSESCHERSPAAHEGDPTICFLEIQSTSTPLGQNHHPLLLALIEYQRHFFAKDFQNVSLENSTLNHLAFEIDSSEYSAWHQRLRSLGLSVQETEFPNMSARAMFFHDPEGNKLELICHVTS